MYSAGGYGKLTMQAFPIDATAGSRKEGREIQIV
jgi:hypothetical protein